MTHILQQSGFTVSSTASGRYALQLIQTQGFDLIVLDLGLPDMDGLEVLRNLRSQKIVLPVLILTAREAALLEILILQAGKVVSKDQIAQRLASTSEALADNAIEVYIHRLRKSQEPYPYHTWFGVFTGDKLNMVSKGLKNTIIIRLLVPVFCFLLIETALSY